MFKFVFWVRFFSCFFFCSSLFSFSKRSFSSTTFLTGLFLLPAINYLVACTTLLQCTDINVSLLNAQAHSYCYFICIGNHRKRTLLTFFFRFWLFFLFLFVFFVVLSNSFNQMSFSFREFQRDLIFSNIHFTNGIQLQWIGRASRCAKKKRNKRMHCIRKPVNV